MSCTVSVRSVIYRARAPCLRDSTRERWGFTNDDVAQVLPFKISGIWICREGEKSGEVEISKTGWASGTLVLTRDGLFIWPSVRVIKPLGEGFFVRCQGVEGEKVRYVVPKRFLFWLVAYFVWTFHWGWG